MKALSLSESMPRIGTGSCRPIPSNPSVTRDCARQQGNHLGPARTHVRGDETPQKRPAHGVAAVGDEVDLQRTGRGVVPVGKGSYRDLLTRFRGVPPLLACGCGAPYRGQQAVDGCRTGGEEALPDGGVEGQVAVLFQGLEETGQDRLEPLATDTVGGLPQDHEGFAHRLVVNPPGPRRGLGPCP